MLTRAIDLSLRKDQRIDLVSDRPFYGQGLPTIIPTLSLKSILGHNGTRLKESAVLIFLFGLCVLFLAHFRYFYLRVAAFFLA